MISSFVCFSWQNPNRTAEVDGNIRHDKLWNLRQPATCAIFYTRFLAVSFWLFACRLRWLRVTFAHGVLWDNHILLPKQVANYHFLLCPYVSTIDTCKSKLGWLEHRHGTRGQGPKVIGKTPWQCRKIAMEIVCLVLVEVCSTMKIVLFLQGVLAEIARNVISLLRCVQLLHESLTRRCLVNIRPTWLSDNGLQRCQGPKL